MSIFSHHSTRSSSRGFTLIEMLVVMSIMVVISIVFLVNQSRFDSSTVLRSLAFSVALSVRQAQVYGTSVFGTTTASSNCTGGFYSTANSTCYAAAYGLYFDRSSPSTYTLFADLNNNGVYNTNEVIKTFSLGTGYTVSDVCVVDSTNTVYCSATCPTVTPLGGGSCSSGSIANMTLLFRRPNPDACIDDGGGFCAPGSSQPFSGAYVQIQASGDSANPKGVTVSTTGEVSVCTGTSC